MYDAPIQVAVVGTTNIVAWADRFYAVPQGLGEVHIDQQADALGLMSYDTLEAAMAAAVPA